MSWEEYHAYFLRSHGFSETYINSHDKKHNEMSRTLKESIMRDRARWAEAARNDPDRLALDEFLAFTHPESSHRALLQMVEDLFEKFGELLFSRQIEQYNNFVLTFVPRFANVQIRNSAIRLCTYQIETVTSS